MDESVLEDFTPSIGRAAPADQGGVARGGSADGFNWILTWEAEDAGRARLQFHDCGRLVWDHLLDGWAVVSALLSGLARSWEWLLLEQVFPSRARPKLPSLLAFELDRTALDLERAAEVFEVFRMRHDCSAWLRGTSSGLRPFWIMREGNAFVFDNGEVAFRSRVGSGAAALEQLGEIISRSGRGRVDADTLESWRLRDCSSATRLASIDLGTSEARVSRLAERGVIELRSRRQALAGLDAVMAAARALASALSDYDLGRIARLIQSQPVVRVADLDALAKEADALVDGSGEERGFRQGRRLAVWLRESLGLSQPGTRFEPRLLLERWGVAVLDVRVASSIEAVAFWSPEHGPAVIVNRDGRSNKGSGRGDFLESGGVRATLAHEICHLLIDRGRRLPVAEALGGDVPEDLEERARAFAAEMLLPYEFAGSAYRRSTGWEEALRDLTMTYGVSRTLAAFQILKCFAPGAPGMPDTDRAKLEAVTRRRASETAR